jgi:RHS repeat-associated protein
MRALNWVLLLIFLSITAAAQSGTSTGSGNRTPLSITPGTPEASYGLSPMENIELFSGRLQFSLPLHQHGGRGEVQIPDILPFEKQWNIRIINQFSANEFAYEAFDFDLDEPRMVMGRHAGYEIMNGSESCQGQSFGPVYAQTLTRLTFTAPDGTEVELRDKSSNGAPHSGLGCEEWGPSRGTVFVSADGSAMTFISDAQIRDNRWQFYLEHPDPVQNKRIFHPSGYLLFRDGTRFRIVDGNLAWARDRNGNKLTFDGGYVDPLGRRTGGWGGTFPDGTGCGVHYNYKGYGGTTRTLNFCYDSLSNRLRNTRPNDSTTTLTYEQLFWSLNWSYSYQRTENYNPPTISSIILPDNVHRYDFYYNQYGELARVVLPGGGAYEYDWDGTQPAESDLVILRRVAERRVYDASGALLTRTTYTREQVSTTGANYLNVIVRTYNGGGAQVAQTKHYFYGNPMYDRPQTMAYPKWRDGREYRTDTFDVVNGSPLLKLTEESKWEQSPPAWWGPYPADNAPPNNPLVTEIKTTLADVNKVAKKTFAYDAYFNKTDVWEYDFGLTPGTVGGLLRHTHTDFLPTYTSPNPSYNSPHMRDLPWQHYTYDAGGTPRSYTSYEYDNYTADATHAALVDRPGITGLCTTHTAAGACSDLNSPAYTSRGNVTAVSRHLLDNNGAVTGSVTEYSQYDVAGNVVAGLDANGNKSESVFDDSFCNSGGCGAAGHTPNTFAFKTTSKTPKPDPTGVYGSQSELVTSAVYDFWTGLTYSTKDPNGQTTGATTFYEYAAPFDRLTKISTPDGGWTSFDYGRSLNAGVTNNYVRKLTALDQSRQVESYQFFDGLGRPNRTLLNEGGAPAVFLITDTQYNALGKVFRTSNPYRATGGSGASINPSGLWTTILYDGLGRTRTVTTPDGATSTTAYAGNTRTVTPPQGPTSPGRSLKSVTDALGRLTEVYEDPAGQNLLTSYTYDVLGNLRRVSQGGQYRYYAFDSLSRILRVRNPEQDVIADPTNDPDFPALSDPVTLNGEWSIAYSYDNNGNLKSRIDARKVGQPGSQSYLKVSFGYDALNRTTTVRYNDGTKDVDRHYDMAVNGKGGLWYFNWDANNNNARFDTHLAIDEYDAVGRPKKYRQHFLTNGSPSPQFTVMRVYDLAGNVIQQTYPSGHVVDYGYDAAGRTESFAGRLGDGVQRTYASLITYSEFGGVREERFGTQTQLYHKLHYNRRGQLFDIRLSSVPWAVDQWNWNRGALVNYFSSNYAWEGDPNTPGGPDNNGNVLRQQHWTPADDAVSNYAYTQDTFVYDSFNRLSSVSEVHGGPWGQSGQDFAQVYSYDRWGNRTINLGQSQYAPVPQYDYDRTNAASTNRLYAPGDLALPDMGQRRMQYDAAGNLVSDSYSGAGSMTYDAEGRLTGSAIDSYGNWAYYTYDADGRRVKRKIANEEWWQVYGVSGELLAEYRAGAAPYAPSKEYGYRNGELLVTMSSGDDQRVKRFVTYLYYGALQRDPTALELQDKAAQLAEAGAQGQAQLLAKAKEIARGLFLQTAYETSPYRSDPQYVTDLYYAYLQRGPDDSGLNWWLGQLSWGRSYACDAFEASSEFQTLVSTLYGSAASDNERTEHFVNNFYLGAYGRFATASELQQQRDALNAAAAQGLSQTQVQAEAMGRSLFATQVNDYSITDQQYVINLYEGFLQRGPDTGGLNFWTSNAAGGPQNRQNVLNAFATCPPFRELSGALYREAFWLIPDHLGTPRMVADRSGSLAGVRRHDYLPFGEELAAGAGGRLPGQGYGGVDNVRQQFTGKERDGETKQLDHFGTRAYSRYLGRFTSTDEPFADQNEGDPQSWNLYAYVQNNPLAFVDPDGMAHYVTIGSVTYYVGDEPGEYDEELRAYWVVDKRKPGGGYWNFVTCVACHIDKPTVAEDLPWARSSSSDYDFSPPVEFSSPVDVNRSASPWKSHWFGVDGLRLPRGNPSQSPLSNLFFSKGKTPTGLRNATPGLRELFSGGSVRNMPIINIRQILLKNGFVRRLTDNRQGILYENAAGEQVRIMSRNGGWEIRIFNKTGNYLDEFGNVAPNRAMSHGINVISK